MIVGLLAAGSLAAGCVGDSRGDRSPGGGSVSCAATGNATTAGAQSSSATERTDSARGGGQTARTEAPTPRRRPEPTKKQVIEAAAAEDRPAGSSEVVIEPDGTTYQPGAGLLPRYTVKTVERKDPTPDDSVMRFVPGASIDLPRPEPQAAEPLEVGPPPAPSHFGPTPAGP